MVRVGMLTGFCLLRSGPTIPQVLISNIFVCLILDPVLLKICVVQVFLQRPHERDRSLRDKLWVRARVFIGNITCFKLGMGTLSRF